MAELERPRIALVVPAYNAAAHLPRLFATVRAQTRPFDDIVVCDDASRDETARVAEELGARVVRHADNRGCSSAKNSGLAQVTSPWVHFHDADDLLLPEFVEAAQSDLAGSDVDAWLPRWRHVDAATGELLGTGLLDADALLQDPVALHLRQTVPNVGVYRTARVRSVAGFDAAGAFLYNEDRAFHLRLAEAGSRFACGTVFGVVTQRHVGSMSEANQLACLRAHAAVTLSHLSAHPNERPDACGAALWEAAAGLATYDALPEAASLVEQAVRLGCRVPPGASALFAAACRLDPVLALRVREHAVRLFKPHLRQR